MIPSYAALSLAFFGVKSNASKGLTAPNLPILKVNTALIQSHLCFARLKGFLPNKAN